MLCAPSSAAVAVSSSEDAYCLEMTSLLLDLSCSSAGRQFLSSRDEVISLTCSLLHTASSRIQKTAVSLLRHLLPGISVSRWAAVLSVQELPVGEGSSGTDGDSSSSGGGRRGSCADFDPLEAGLLDVLLACVAKALTVQTKVRGTTSSTSASSASFSTASSVASSPYHMASAAAPSSSPAVTAAAAAVAAHVSSKHMSAVTLATSIHPRDDLRGRWFMKGCMRRSTADAVMTLLKDLSSGNLGHEWRSAARACVTECILNLTRLREELRVPSECLRTPTLWLALASLCVMDQEQADRLSNWLPGVPGSKASAAADSPPQQQRVRE